MKKDVWLFLGIETDRLLVGNEVNFVTPSRQLNPQLGAYHSAASVRRITSDSDLHGFYV